MSPKKPQKLPLAAVTVSDLRHDPSFLPIRNIDQPYRRGMTRSQELAILQGMPAFCPLCAKDDRTETHELDDGSSYAICFHSSHGTDGYIWEPSPSMTGTSKRSEGIGAELDVWNKLLECFEDNADYVSYGEIEDRFFARHAEEASTLLHRYGHRWRDTKHRAGQYSMSAYLALRLRDLEKDDHLDLRWGPAEGPWKYNEVISYWRIRR